MRPLHVWMCHMAAFFISSHYFSILRDVPSLGRFPDPSLPQKVWFCLPSPKCQLVVHLSCFLIWRRWADTPALGVTTGDAHLLCSGLYELWTGHVSAVTNFNLREYQLWCVSQTSDTALPLGALIPVRWISGSYQLWCVSQTSDTALPLGALIPVRWISGSISSGVSPKLVTQHSHLDAHPVRWISGSTSSLVYLPTSILLNLTILYPFHKLHVHDLVCINNNVSLCVMSGICQAK